MSHAEWIDTLLLPELRTAYALADAGTLCFSIGHRILKNYAAKPVDIYLITDDGFVRANDMQDDCTISSRYKFYLLCPCKIIDTYYIKDILDIILCKDVSNKICRYIGRYKLINTKNNKCIYSSNCEIIKLSSNLVWNDT